MGLKLALSYDQISADWRRETSSLILAMKEAEFGKLPPLIKSLPRRDLQSIIYNFLGVCIWK